MKKKYEKNESIIIISWLFIFIVLVVGWIILNREFYIYKKFSGILYTDTVIEVVLNKEDTKLLQRNKKVFINDSQLKVQIIRIEKNVIKKNNQSYNQVFLEIGKGKGKTGDVVEFTVIEKRIKIRNIFRIIWEGDNYRKN